MKRLLTVAATILLASCGGGGGGGSSSLPPPPPPPPPPAPSLYTDVTATNLTASETGGRCMDAEHGDFDGDGDLDLALAQEMGTNIILLNNGSGVFSRKNGAVAGGAGDNEDLRLRDIDGDGDLDMLTVHEDDRVHALLLNDGNANFSDVSSRIPVNSTANAAEVIDLDMDSLPDILIGNEGTNLVLIQQMDGSFVDDTANRPIGGSVTQDLLLVDVDGDMDLDLYISNETANELHINDGTGVFTNESAQRLPPVNGESRQADAADIDNDGDLDIVVGNVAFNMMLPVQNQLLVNDGSGVFSDETAARLAGVANAADSFTIHFFDIDGDGDVDILSPINRLGTGGSMDFWSNDGTGQFTTFMTPPLSAAVNGSTFDIEFFDANGDGMTDIYFCHRTGNDQLYLRQ